MDICYHFFLYSLDGQETRACFSFQVGSYLFMRSTWMIREIKNGKEEAIEKVHWRQVECFLLFYITIYPIKTGDQPVITQEISEVPLMIIIRLLNLILMMLMPTITEDQFARNQEISEVLLVITHKLFYLIPITLMVTTTGDQFIKNQEITKMLFMIIRKLFH